MEYNEFDMDDGGEYIDIDATVEAIREAWKCAPTYNLSRLLDEVTAAPFSVLTNDELLHELNEFIIQNQ